MLKIHDRIFIRLNKTPERGGRINRQNHSYYYSASALLAMRTRCKKGDDCNALQFEAA